MLRRLVPLLLSVLLVAMASSDALAQSKDPAAADALFRAGRDAMKRGDFATACPKFAESQRLDPAPGTLLNLAQCEEASGKTASAVQHYRDVAELLSGTDPRAGHSKARVAALLPQVPKLTIKLTPDAPPGTSISRGDIELGAASLGEPLPVDPGEHLIVVAAPGHKSWRTTVKIRLGESRTVIAGIGEVDLASSTARAHSTTETTSKHTRSEKMSPGPTEDGSGSTVRTLGFVAGGLGILGLATGTFFAVRSKSKNDEALKDYCHGTVCTDPAGIDLTNEARDAGKLSAVGFIAGGALLTTGIVMLIAAPSEPVPQSKAVGPSPRRVAAGLGGPGTWLGASVVGTW